jgi:hypothetical protein
MEDRTSASTTIAISSESVGWENWQSILRKLFFVESVRLPGTHDSMIRPGTCAFDKTKKVLRRIDSDLTETIQEKLDRDRRLLGKLNDFILRMVFEHACSWK